MAEEKERAKKRAEGKCVECGRIVDPSERDWRKCYMCGDPICIEHSYYLKTKVKGLYDYYYDTVRVCKRHKV